MKILFVTASILGLSSCSEAPKPVSDSFPDYLPTATEDWITYEGILPSENGQPVGVTLQLMPGSPGMDGYFKMQETLDLPGLPRISMGTRTQGQYSLLLGSGPYHIIRISHRILTGSLMIGKDFGPSDLVRDDLFLKGIDEHQLVLVNDKFNEIDPGYSLIRRSDLFTVEGYFTVYPDTTEFYERNTQKKWAVARLASYDEAVKKYRLLAREKFEGIYLKALSYSVRYSDPTGKEINALVFKRILTMDSTTGFKNH